MIAPNDITNRIDEVQTSIAADDILSAIKKLMDYVRDFSENRDYLNEVIVISGNFFKLDKELRRQVIDYNEHTKVRNGLMYQMLDLVDSVQNDIAFGASLAA